MSSSQEEPKMNRKDKIQTFCDDNEITCDFEEVNSSKKSGTILAQGRKEGVEVKKGVTLNCFFSELIF